MNVDKWFEWPTKSPDASLNVVILIVLILMFAAALAVSVFLLIPLGLGFGLFKWAQWYARRPVPTGQIYADTNQRVIAANFPATDSFVNASIRRLYEAWRPDLPIAPIYTAMSNVAEFLYGAEAFNNPLPPAPTPNTIAEGRYRDRLLSHMRRSEDAPATLATFADALSLSFSAFRDALPQMARTTPQNLLKETEADVPTVPVIDLLPDVGTLVWRMTIPFYSERISELELFAELRQQLDANLTYASEARRVITPDESKLSPRELVGQYLGRTPLHALFDADVPFDVLDDLGEHGLVVGASGWGKTELFKSLTLRALQDADPPSLIILTSQGAMLDAIQKLAVFAPGQKLSERLVVIDPEADPPPALNVFALPTERTNAYSRNVREQVEAGTTEALQYLCASLASELTGKQTTALIFVVSLMISIEGATLTTLRELFEEEVKSIEHSKFAGAIAKLDPTAQAFFANQFFTRSFSDTRQQIARRIYRILAVPSFSRMFGSAVNRLDMFSLMQKGSICLVNTRKLLMGEDASSLFGRYIISTVLRAAFERVAVDKPRRCYLMIDEASEFCDQSFENLLSKVRQFNVGVLIAFQHVTQIGGVLNSVLANTAVKLAGGLNMHDARVLAGEMRCDPSFIADLKKTPAGTSWACHVRNMTDRAIRLDVPYGMLDREPRMTAEAHAQLVAENAKRYAAPLRLPAPTVEREPVQAASAPATMPASVEPSAASPPRAPVADIDADVHTRPSKDW
jgi:hypothetical protein